MDAIHALLQLQTGEALLNQTHPGCKDWEPDVGGGIKRIFAAGPKSKAYTQAFGRNMPENSAQFLNALGKPAQRSILLYLMVNSQNWRLNPDGDYLQKPPFFVLKADSPNVNRLFVALYNLMFSKLTNMAFVMPSRNCNLRQIFKKKVPGTDQDLIGQQLIAYLKWLIYVAAYEDRSTLAHQEFYQKQIVIFKNPETYKVWRTLLYKELNEWYTDHPQASKKRKRTGGASRIVDVVVGGDEYLNENFVDLLDNLKSGAGTVGPGLWEVPRLSHWQLPLLWRRRRARRRRQARGRRRRPRSGCGRRRYHLTRRAAPHARPSLGPGRGDSCLIWKVKCK
jgi:ubiquitin